MLAAFYMFMTRATCLPWWGILYLKSGKLRRLPRRLLLLLVIYPLFVTLQALHWLGFLLDELLFRGYRKVAVQRPVFIVGPPRSGTTLLQRTLARDPGFTTFKTWECLFAPSISERYIWRALARLLTPLAPLVHRHRPAFLRQLDRIHATGLAEPEEDNLVLLPIFATLLMFVFLPARSLLTELTFFDRLVPADRRRVITEFYYRCVQKHLYFHGPEKRFLSKNPTYTAMVESLAGQFPGARFVVCTRAPVETTPSVLSLLATALDMAGRDMTPQFRDEVLALQHFYYSHLRQALPGVDPQAPVIAMISLKQQLPETLESLYRNLGQPMMPEFRAVLADEADTVRRHVSSHDYDPETFGLDRAALASYFADVWPPVCCCQSSGNKRSDKPENHPVSVMLGA